MFNHNSEETKKPTFMVYLVYYILLGPLSVILILNQLIAPLAPSVSFVDLEKN